MVAQDVSEYYTSTTVFQSLVTIQACRLKKYFHLATFFQYNKCLLRQKTGGACLYMPQKPECWTLAR